MSSCSSTPMALHAIKTTRDLGLLIRKERKKQLFNQAELAGLSNVGNRFIVDLEQGKNTIEFEKALHIAHMLGISLKATSSGDS